MLKFSQFLLEILLPSERLHRVDQAPPKAFGPGARTYVQKKNKRTGAVISGQVRGIQGNPRGLTGPSTERFKGVYAAKPKHAAPYVIPHDVGWVHHTGPSGKTSITINHNDLEKVQNARPTVSEFHPAHFKQINDTEYISKTGHGLVRPISQREVNPIEHLAKYGIKLRTTTNNLASHMLELEKQGHTIHGAEGI